MALKERQWFFQTTSTNERFVKGDCPSEETMRNFVDSVIFKSQSDDKAKVNDDSIEFFNLVGHVVLANDDDVRNRISQPTNKALVVQPHQIPVVKGTDVVHSFEDGHDVYTVYNTGTGGPSPLQLVLDTGNTAEQSIEVGTDLVSKDNGYFQVASGSLTASATTSNGALGPKLSMSDAGTGSFGIGTATGTQQLGLSSSNVQLISFLDGLNQTTFTAANGSSTLSAIGGDLTLNTNFSSLQFLTATKVINLYNGLSPSSSPGSSLIMGQGPVNVQARQGNIDVRSVSGNVSVNTDASSIVLNNTTPEMTLSTGVTTGSKVTLGLSSASLRYDQNPTTQFVVGLSNSGVVLQTSATASGASVLVALTDITIQPYGTGGNLILTNIPVDVLADKIVLLDQNSNVRYISIPANDGNTYKLVKSDAGLAWVLDT